MTPDLACLHLARITIETKTALSIGTGLGAGLYDPALVRDANSLLAIPGASIAGVLRHLFQRQHGCPATEVLFGRARRGEERASRLHVSWACIHDAKDQPVEGLVLGELRAGSPSIFAWQSIVRRLLLSRPSLVRRPLSSPTVRPSKISVALRGIRGW